MRINRFFTENGICSRRAADRLIEAGRVSINGHPAKLGDVLRAEDVVAVDGKKVATPKKKPTIIAFNKPVGIESTTDTRTSDNIIEAVNFPERVFPIGRLDKMSEGLILLTNRGEIVNKILRRQYSHEKEYVVVFEKKISQRAIDKMAAGIELHDGVTAPCRVRRLGDNRVSIILTEGRNRQIRRMGKALGHRVVRLKRIRVMNVILGDLKPGKWRKLRGDEERKLLSALELPS